MFKKLLKKASLMTLAGLIIAQNSMFVFTAHAAGATLSVSNPSSVTLVNGCPSTIDIELNTGGESILAGDTRFTLSGDATIDNVSIGDILPMQTYNQIDAGEIKLSGARFPGTGGYNGDGVLGTLNITPNSTSGSVVVDFSSDIVIDNNIVNDDIQNVLSSVSGGTYTVRDKYNSDINGGYCDPDVSSPVFSLIDPTSNSKNNPADTNITLTLTDNRSGVNINTLQYTVNGTAPVDATIVETGGAYQVVVNPTFDFTLGSQVSVTVLQICDNDGNCLNNQTKSFRISPPASCGDGTVDEGEECDEAGNNQNMNDCTTACTVATCGDGYYWWGHEECDDGNTISNDGCSDSCTLESGIITETVVVTDCPDVEIIECPTCEVETIIEYIQPEDVDEEEIEEAVETATEALQEAPTELAVAHEANIENSCDAYAFEEDNDKDGLSDRTECYFGTDPNDNDTDGDSCKDGDEINQFVTNPLVADCEVKEKIKGEVIITDPQPGWIVSTLKINGTTPKGTLAVDVVAFPADSRVLEALINELTTAITTNTKNLDSLFTSIEDTRLFVDSYGEEYDYDDLALEITKLENILGGIDEKIKNGQDADMRRLASNLVELQKLQEVSAYLGKSLPNAETDTMEIGTLRFTLEPFDNRLDSDKLYDLVATSLLSDGEKISSVPIRINVNKDMGVKMPIPRFIGGKKIPGTIASEGLFIAGATANADGSLEIEITDERPLISGDSEFGSQVFAVWESVVLSSSVISDSEEGSFAIRPPKDLEANESHKVTLYALKSVGENKIRSENVEVHFYVKKEGGSMKTAAIVIAILVLLTLLLLYVRRRIKNRNVIKKLIAEAKANDTDQQINKQ